jgi:hypothetical protein
MERMDGTQAQVVFPYFISPHQPMRDLRAITHLVEPGVWAEVRFSGEVFEMEDQRNWTDNSYKTYSTPLELPSPVWLPAGTRIEQSITLTVVGRGRQPAVALQDGGLELSATEAVVKPKPGVGLGYASHGTPLSSTELERIRALGLNHLRVDLRLQDASWKSLLQQASGEAWTLGVGLHLALHLSHDAESELAGLAREVEWLGSPVLLWMVFSTTEAVTPLPLLQSAIRVLQPLAPRIPFAAGTDHHFAELNRQRPKADTPALPCFSINPQVHACDDDTVVDNLAAQRYPLETLQQFTRLPAVISPITLRPRFNPAAGRWTGRTTDSRGLPGGADVRQVSLLGAGWTLGSLATLLVAEPVHSLTYYETTGCLGIMETRAGSPAPDTFPSLPGGVFPMYHVFADLADCDQAFEVRSSHPRQILALGLVTRHHRRRILVANMTGLSQTVRLRVPGDSVQGKFLDEINGWESCRNSEIYRGQAAVKVPVAGGILQVKLLPYALARLDVE